MKKKILGIALLAMAAVLPAAAQSDNNSTCTQNLTTQKCGKTATKQRACQAPNPFEGLNLTEAQKTKLDDLRKAHTDQNKTYRKQAADARRDESKARKQNYLNDVKAVLTPEQYVQFLENQFINGGGPRMGKLNADRARADRPRKANKGDRPARQQKNAQQPQAAQNS